MKEYLDVVDEEDRIIGRCSRDKAHSEGLRHRTVMFFLMDTEGRIMVTKRSEKKDFFPGYKSVVMGGHVGAGSTYGDALEKEVKEEAGTMGEYVKIGEFFKDIPEEKENVMLFTVYVKPQEVEICRDEFESGEFLELEEVYKLVRDSDDFLPETDIVLKLLEDFLRERGK